MSYCAQADLPLDETTLIQLTDDTGSGVVNAGLVTDAINRQAELIDGYLRGRYTLPLENPPSLLKDINADLAVHWLHRRRTAGAELPEGIKDAHKTALKLLEQMQAGKLLLGAGALTETPVDGAMVDIDAPDRVFDSSTLADY